MRSKLLRGISTDKTLALVLAKASVALTPSVMYKVVLSTATDIGENDATEDIPMSSADTPPAFSSEINFCSVSLNAAVLSLLTITSFLTSRVPDSVKVLS